MTADKIKVLIADDDKDILEFLSYNLKNDGYLTFKAENGVEAILLAIEEQPQVIIMDVMMPELDGIEACKQLREKPEFKNTLIVFLTARNEDYAIIAGYEAGGDDYICKPVKVKVLLTRLKALLRRYDLKEDNSGTEISDAIQFDDLTIDPERHQIVMNEKEYLLPKKEFRLLMLLTSKPSRVFTRIEIFDHLWGGDYTVSDRTIDVYIRKLRERIGEDKIITIKGVGYKFEN